MHEKWKTNKWTCEMWVSCNILCGRIICVMVESFILLLIARRPFRCSIFQNAIIEWFVDEYLSQAAQWYNNNNNELSVICVTYSGHCQTLFETNTIFQCKSSLGFRMLKLNFVFQFYRFSTTEQTNNHDQSRANIICEIIIMVMTALHERK